MSTSHAAYEEHIVGEHIVFKYKQFCEHKKVSLPLGNQTTSMLISMLVGRDNTINKTKQQQ